MRSALLLFLCSMAAEAGVVRGIVLERLSGLPLARTMVRLQPVPRPGIENQVLQQRADRFGHFTFLSVPDGLYILFAVRENYFPTAHGQRLPGGQGTPFEVKPDSDLFSELRMPRKGAITGRVLDENGIGLIGVQVLAYRAKLPLRSVASGVSDDRGVYRIHGLEPGKYWVRSAAQNFDDGLSIIPTFGPESREVHDAGIHVVRLDSDTLDADVRPMPGRLLRLQGSVLCEAGPVALTLSSETGRRQIQTGCNALFTFPNLAPGNYEIAGVSMANGYAGFVELPLDRDSNNAVVQLVPPPIIEIETWRTNTGLANIPATLIARRDDLSESAQERIIQPKSTLEPGHWEMRAVVPADQYVESINNMFSQSRRYARTERAAEWFDVFVEMRPQARIRIAIARPAAKMEGIVMRDAKPVPGSPVFLWPAAETTRRQIGGWKMTLADVDGKFHFEGLPPGDYRLVATFDLSEVDEDAIELAQAVSFHIEASSQAAAELTLWIAPAP